MIFAYPYRKKDEGFIIDQSIRLVKHHFEGDIVTIGDKHKNYDNIKCSDGMLNRGANVTNKLLKVAATCEEFIFMNDDFMLNHTFQFDKHHKHTEKLIRRNGKASAEWNQAVDNTKHWLRYNGYETNCYENHQPLLINSRKFIDLMGELDWKHNAHFIKSLYCNVYEKKTITIDNTKLIRPDIKRANLLYEFTGCFSIGDGFFNNRTRKYLQELH